MKTAMSDEKEIRRRNPERTKARILAAAQRAFAETGYSRTGIRQIATLADIDSALIQRYYGSKAGLFEAALSDAIPRFEDFDTERSTLGARLTTEFLASLFDLRAHSMIVLSTSDAEACAICERVLEAKAIAPLVEWLGPPDARTRAVRLVMLATGFMLFTRQVQLMTPESAVESGTSGWLSDLLQDIIRA